MPAEINGHYLSVPVILVSPEPTSMDTVYTARWCSVRGPAPARNNRSSMI
ncbi:hypothetical protein SAMN05518683_1112 [Salibacterium halotolerans]|uniref:Uncharacterized protein n=1 Tax=Salibacterium halotolerans TaxID=1884432 RepID=A0A1I5TLJ1_9BACI|nr:hypothetical protein SAMN05518683_1112 [Salibacterium halotolerans]